MSVKASVLKAASTVFVNGSAVDGPSAGGSEGSVGGVAVLAGKSEVPVKGSARSGVRSVLIGLFLPKPKSISPSLLARKDPVCVTFSCMYIF